MLDKILGMTNYSEFLSMSCAMLKGEQRSTLFHEIAGRGMLLSSSDLWEDERVLQAVSSEVAVTNALQAVQGESESSRLVKILQMLGQGNPGLEKPLTNYLQRACI